MARPDPEYAEWRDGFFYLLLAVLSLTPLIALINPLIINVIQRARRFEIKTTLVRQLWICVD
jgi:hypothetical protein